MFDVFVAALKCPSCGRAVSISANTAMQTHLRDDARGDALGVGFEFDPRDLTVSSIVNSGYALVTEPPAGGPVRLLELWTCPEGQTEEWAVVTITDGRIAQIEAVTLTRATLEAANFISDVNAALAAERVGGASAVGLPPVEILRRQLT